MAIYGTLEAADAYHAARGNSAWAAGSVDDRTAALERGSDYVDLRYGAPAAACGGLWFPGEKTGGRAQERQWPRTGATDRAGNAIPVDEVPAEVERAAYEAAYRELVSPGSLSPDFIPGGQVTREKVGPIEVSYAAPQGGDQPPNRPVVPMIDEILAALLVRRYCGPAVLVV